MDITSAFLRGLWDPTFLLDFPILHNVLSTTAAQRGQAPWATSQLNPKNRVDSQSSPHGRSWNIQGGTAQGHVFYIVPPLDDPIPLGIHLYLPDLSQYDMGLRLSLDHSAAAVLQDASAIASLGISRHLCKALNSYCEQNPEFLSRYNDLPFGSRFYLTRLEPNPRECDFELVIDDAPARFARTVVDLDKLWPHLDLVQRMTGNILTVEALCLVRYLHDSTCVVKRRATHGHVSQKPYVFKTYSGDFQHLYHELRLLLSFPPHPHIMPPPLGLVTARIAGKKDPGVVGFLLPYYEKGALLGALPRHKEYSTLRRLEWSKQLTAALLHINEACGTFYSDLRPSNVLLSSSADIILCDFEQRGNWKEWLPPEVRYPNYAGRMIVDAGDDWDWRGVGRWTRLLRWHLDRASAFLDTVGDYDDLSKFTIESNLPWFMLSRAEVGKAQVFSLGLMMYCIFEGTSNVEMSLFHSWPVEPEVEFPFFKRTPLELRDIIKRCTLGARSWDSSNPTRSNDTRRHQAPQIERRGFRFFVAGSHYQELDPNVELQVLDAAKAWWENELGVAQAFLDRQEHDEDKRPTLSELLTMLESVRLP